MRLSFVVFFLISQLRLLSQESVISYLSGTDKDHTVQWDFSVSKGMNSGQWKTIPVPSCWEQQGFGTFNYGEDKINPEEIGRYRHAFKTQAAWKNKKIFIVFEGSMTDTEVKIDGILAGPIHQGGFYQFRYEITDKLKPGIDHLLEVTVAKKSANISVNRAERQSDFWLFGGIFRPVFLEVVPNTFIERVAVDAKADGSFGIQVFTHNTHINQKIQIQLQELNGKNVGNPFYVLASDSVFPTHTFHGIKTWNPEQPNLYQAVISITEGNKILHTIKQRFGFRTILFRSKEGFYVNGVKIILKGVNRHSQWPESGRTLSRDIHLLDIGLIKDMNMNAVRMSHYPPDREFLDLCDSLGLFVLDELTGWQKAYDTIAGRPLVKELVIRDVNHPSIIIWDNGNEGGWNRALDGDYEWYDPQKRFVLHPWERFNGTETKHYQDFNYVTNAVLYGTEVYFPTEFMHGLFDGGHGAGLDDFWNEMMKHRGFSGGFLWSFHDEGVVRNDKDNFIDVAGNSAPDGIVGPHREKEASYYTIKEIWSPVYINTKTIPRDFNGKLEIENRYLYTNLSDCKFEWKIIALPASGKIKEKEKTFYSGIAKSPQLSPGEQGWLTLNYPKGNLGDALYLTAYDPKGKEIFTWSWSLTEPKDVVKNFIQISPIKNVSISSDGGQIGIACDGIIYHFDTATGFLNKIDNGFNEIMLTDGPSLAGVKLSDVRFKYYKNGTSYVVQSSYNEGKYSVQWTFQSGTLPRLEYKYVQKGTFDFMGVTFNFPEDKINGMEWMGRGPYRVWKNRLKGQRFGVWQKSYNNTVTGESWDYPEFKGWHSEMYWVTILTKQGDFTVYTDQSDIFLEMLHPDKPKGQKNENTSPPFPEGNIGFMNAISPIGTKFQAAALLGPQSQQNLFMNSTPVSGSLYFDFRKKK